MPEKNDDALLILSRDGMQDVLRAHGSAAWKLDRKRAKAAKYLILAHNAPKDVTAHRKAFLVAKITGFVPRVAEGEPQNRWAVAIDSYAEVEVADAWTKGNRFPLQYVNAEEVLGECPSSLAFKPVGEKTLEWSYSQRMKQDEASPPRPLTIAKAKQGLAANFRCEVSDIEIVIRA